MQRLRKCSVPLWEKSLPRQAGYSLYEREMGLGDFLPLLFLHRKLQTAN